MFSGNHKISNRQLFRNSSAGFISLSALIVPLVMNQKSITSILFALLFLGVFLYGTAWAPRPQNVWMKGICYLHYWVLGTMTVRLAGLLIQKFLLTQTALWIIIGWLCLFCYYNLYKGLECRVRVSEILFPFFLFLFFLLPILMFGEVDLSRCKEIRFLVDINQLTTGYQVFCWLTAVQSLWHLHGQTGQEDTWRKTVGYIFATGTIAAILWALFTYCVYGNSGHTGLIFPLASAMTLAHLPGNLIGRMDSMFVFAWVIGFFLLCSSLFSPLSDSEPDTQKKYLLFAILTASFATALHPKCIEWGQVFLYMVSTPIQIFLVFCNMIKKNGAKKMTACFLLFSMFLLTGCGAQELEEQSVVTSISVDVGEEKDYLLTLGFGSAEDEGPEPLELETNSLKEAEQMYWESDQKYLNYNHLKNFYFSSEIISQESFLKLLEEVQLESSYSRGTAVYITLGDAAKEAEREEQPDEGMPIHRLLNAWKNKEGIKIPTITRKQEYKGSIFWQSYP